MGLVAAPQEYSGHDDIHSHQLPWHTDTKNKRGLTLFTNISKKVPLGTLSPSQKIDKEKQEVTYQGDDYWGVFPS